MLAVLEEALERLPAWLQDGAWESLDIDYHPPRVERLYRPWGERRVYLHALHPCAESEALFHPHPWPSAMRVLEGRYEMGLGHGAGEQPPPIAARLVAEGPMSYEMTDPDAWHYVRPLGGLAWTVMVTGRPWERSSPRSPRPLSPLPRARADELLAHFQALLGGSPS